MSNESLLIFDNIKKFRGILKEYVSRGDIGKAIDNRSIIKITYDSEDTHRVGWRTIEPHAIGYLYKTDKDGNQQATNRLAVRAWQQAGSSDTYQMPPVGRWKRNPRRDRHELWTDTQAGDEQNLFPDQPGWRLFKLDGISGILPTGDNFEVRKTFRSGDQQLSVVKEVKPDSFAGGKQDGLTPTDEPTKPSAFDPQTSRWKTDVGDHELMKAVLNWENKINKFDKRNRNLYDMFRDKNGDYHAVNRTYREYPKWVEQTEKVGSLMDLFNKYGKQYEKQKQVDDPNWKKAKFFDKMNAIADMADKKAQLQQKNKL